MAAGAPKIVLALGGGGARGFAHVGVLEELEARGARVAGITGVSAGALAGAGFALGHRSEQMRVRIAEFLDSPLANPSILRHMVEEPGSETDSSLADRVMRLFIKGRVITHFLLHAAIMGQEYFARVIDFFLPDTLIEDLPLPFWCVATDVKTGEAVIFDRGPLRRAVLASSAVPGMCEPVEVNGRFLMDGGVAALVPLDAARLMAAERWGGGLVAAVNVDRNVVTNQVPETALECYLRAGEIQSHLLNRKMLAEADVVIEPLVGEVNWAEFDRADWLIEQGVAAARAAWPRLVEAQTPPGIWARLRRLAQGVRSRGAA
ncbi:MAG: patatin-like phospholipase family protein [Deltaproteobacteria bacterium]|nr:patatin-like phospholipase family protein [Deltaproteobacteria bacterium]